MRLNLTEKKLKRDIEVGDVLVYAGDNNRECCYMVVQKSASWMDTDANFLVVRMDNAVLFSVEADSTEELTRELGRRFTHLTLTDVIPANELELNRI